MGIGGLLHYDPHTVGDNAVPLSEQQFYILREQNLTPEYVKGLARSDRIRLYLRCLKETLKDRYALAEQMQKMGQLQGVELNYERELEKHHPRYMLSRDGSPVASGH